ncbi:STAS domain-containing protein [Mucilaginibacter gotjawali]
MFFGAAYKFKDTMRVIEYPAPVLIIRMRHVPVIDATGIRVLREVHEEIKRRGSKLILSEVTSEQVMTELRKARLVFHIGKANVTDTFEKAMTRTNEILLEKKQDKAGG